MQDHTKNKQKTRLRPIIAAVFYILMLCVIGLTIITVSVTNENVSENVGYVVFIACMIGIPTILGIGIGREIKKWKDKRAEQTNNSKEEKPAQRPKRVVYVDQMTGVQFEYYCALLLKKPEMGFVRVEYTKTSGDYGGDLIAYHKNGSKWVIQCKRYKSHVGIDAVQQVLGAKNMYNAERMAVMTNNVLTASAKNLANRSGVIIYEGLKGSLTYDN